jgi:hypothetical protein
LIILFEIFLVNFLGRHVIFDLILYNFDVFLKTVLKALFLFQEDFGMKARFNHDETEEVIIGELRF